MKAQGYGNFPCDEASEPSRRYTFAELFSVQESCSVHCSGVRLRSPVHDAIGVGWDSRAAKGLLRAREVSMGNLQAAVTILKVSLADPSHL